MSDQNEQNTNGRELAPQEAHPVRPETADDIQYGLTDCEEYAARTDWKVTIEVNASGEKRLVLGDKTPQQFEGMFLPSEDMTAGTSLWISMWRFVTGAPPAEEEAWGKVCLLFRQYFADLNLFSLRAFYSAIAAHYLSRTKVWPMLIAPPGSVKTTVLNTLKGRPNTIKLLRVITWDLADFADWLPNALGSCLLDRDGSGLVAGQRGHSEPASFSASQFSAHPAITFAQTRLQN